MDCPVLCKSKDVPIYKNTIAASNFKKNVGIRFATAIEPPAMAPIKLAIIRASEDPINTASGFLVVVLNAIVVSCVLSPSSAKKTVMKVVKNSVISMVI